MADEALEEKEATAFWVNKTLRFYENVVITGMTWISAIRAHALMLLERVSPARAFYNSFKTDPKLVLMSWETSVLRDFVRLRKAGLFHPLMEEIEKQYASAGWTAQLQNSMGTGAEAEA